MHIVKTTYAVNNHNRTIWVLLNLCLYIKAASLDNTLCDDHLSLEALNKQQIQWTKI